MTLAFWDTVLKALQAGKTVWLVTVAAASGSTPQRPGALMAVGPAGRLEGTIGGGALEYDCVRQVTLGQAEPGLRHLSLEEGDPDGVGMICGGATDLLFTPLTDPQLARAAKGSLRTGNDVMLCLPIDGSAPHLAPRAPERTAPAWVKDPDEQLELPLLELMRVYVVGGGHVGQEVCRLLGQLHYRHYLVDDRPEYADPALFPDAEGVFCTGYAAMEGLPAPTARDAICIMTRGHEGDAAALRWALNTQAGYIGLMGSRRKREKLLADLAAAGFDQAAQRITTPIGLAIGAETPAEIAVSVCAQLVAFARR